MQRPTSVTVFGVLNIVFSALGAVGIASSAAVLLVLPRVPEVPTVPDAWMVASLVWGGIAAVLLLVSGIGLLRMRRWGRVAAVWYAITTVALTAAGLVIHWIYVVNPTLAMARAPDGAVMPEAIGASIGGIVGGLFGLIYPALLWVFMTRRKIVAAFQGDAIEAVEASWNASVPHAPGPADASNPYGSPHTDALVPRHPGEIPTSESIVEAFVPTRNGPALASYYLGLFSLFPCLGLPLGIAAVYFGLKGLRRVRDNPEVRGGAHAWAGVICGSLFGLFNFALAALLIVAGVAAALTQ